MFKTLTLFNGITFSKWSFFRSEFLILFVQNQPVHVLVQLNEERLETWRSIKLPLLWFWLILKSSVCMMLCSVGGSIGFISLQNWIAHSVVWIKSYTFSMKNSLTSDLYSLFNLLMSEGYVCSIQHIPKNESLNELKI